MALGTLLRTNNGQALIEIILLFFPGVIPGEAKLQCWVCSDYRDQTAQISSYGRNIVPPCDDDIGSANYGVLVDVADSENYMCTVFHRNDQYG
jgi:hypothetical protein